MDTIKYSFKRLDKSNSDIIRKLFASVFTKGPWNDDWSDENQLRSYIHDLVGQDNSLTFGLYEGNELIGISMGHIKHWYTGTECFIDFLLTGKDVPAYKFYKKRRFFEAESMVVFAKDLKNK